MWQKPSKEKKPSIRINDQIRVPKIFLVKEGKKMGVYDTHAALALAREMNLDLVEISPNVKPPVCSLMDYGKFKYEQSKKQKQQKNSETKEKEIVFRYVTEEHDLVTKANQAINFLSKGFKVKLIVRFKERENAHRDKGFVVMKRCLELIKDVATVEREPFFEGNRIVCRLVERKK